MSEVYRHDFSFSLGRGTVLTSAQGVCFIAWGDMADGATGKFIQKYFRGAAICPGEAVGRQAAQEISEYFAGKRREFTVPLDLRPTGFCRTVLLAVKQIPYGQTCTYGEIAARVGKPKAARAVGGANRSNPLAPLIPCHRVVAANGLGGYAGGLEMKRRLLEMEGALMPRQAAETP